MSEVTQTSKDKHGMSSLIGGVKTKIINLQSTAPERLHNKEGQKRNTWISLGRGSRKGLLGKLGVKVGRMEGMGTRRSRLGELGVGGRLEAGWRGRDVVGGGDISGLGRTWCKGNPHEATKKTPTKTPSNGGKGA